MKTSAVISFVVALATCLAQHILPLPLPLPAQATAAPVEKCQ
jgi:hypothetical protein